MYIVSSRVGTPLPSFSEGCPPPFWVAPLSEENQKSTPLPLFLRAIQIGTRKLYETL